MPARDWDVDQRAELIWERLSAHIESIYTVPLRWAPAQWDPSLAPFGYGMPVIGFGGISVWLCPERIAETAAWLNEFDLDEYLGSIEFTVDWCLAHHQMGGDEALARLHESMKVEAPGTLKLVLEVQKNS